MSRHSFDPEIAKQVGVNAAVIYQNILWWAERNAANNNHNHEGYWWTYNSVAAFAELFPYLTGKQIRTSLDRLEEHNLIISGNFNKSAYDRTKWYAPTCPIGKHDLPLVANEVAQVGEPIPVINTDGKRDIKKTVSEDWHPVDFQPQSKSAQIVAGWTQEEYQTSLEHFLQHHRSKGSKFVDWQSAWGTWVLNSAKYKGHSNGKNNRTTSRGQRGSSADGFTSVLREVGSRENAFPTFADDERMQQAPRISFDPTGRD